MGATYRLPDHHGQIVIDSDKIRLTFPRIQGIRDENGALLHVVSHTLTILADDAGMANVEALLYLRRAILAPGNQQLLIAYAKRGRDFQSVLSFYKEVLFS